MKLTKAGKNYRGLSPFRKEKTPSFYVSPDRGMYYCFSTSKGGDIFTFVEEMEGVDFRGALKILAERAGVELTVEPKGARDEKERMYLVLEDATDFFESNLTKNTEALEYLTARGVEKKTVEKFRLGFALESWDGLYKHLRAKGYTDHELERVGLIKRGEKGKYYDRFRSRIMFPIADSAGRIVAFSGRITGKAAQEKENAKYLNSPETPLFDKSRVLYGYDKAKHAIRKYNFSIIVEGQMDLVMSHQAGYGNAVAASGTGLTQAHLEQLSRISPNVVMAFDADSAGIASASRSARLALSMGMEVKVAALPKGSDPADIIKDNPDAWRAAVRDAMHIAEFSLNIIEGETSDLRDRVKRVRLETLPFVASMPNRMDQAYFVARIADRLHMKEELVWEEVGKYASLNTESQSPAGVEKEKKREIHTRLTYLERLIAGWYLFVQESDRQHTQHAAGHIASEYERITSTQLETKARQFEGEKASLMFEVELIFAEDEKKEKVAGLFKEFEHEWINKEIEELSQGLKEAERSLDEVRAESILNIIKEKSAYKDALGRSI